MKTENSLFTLDELAREVGIESRTIRSYIQQNLLRGPETRGRNARYSEHHLQRLKVIKLLKDDLGLQLAEIRRILLAGGDDIKKIMELTSQGGDSAPVEGQLEQDTPLSALSYIRAIKDRQAPPSRVRQLASETSSPSSLDKLEQLLRQTSTAGDSPIVKVLSTLESAVGNDKVARNCRGKNWIHIEVTPDIVLMVRGTYGLSDIALLEKVADHIRHIIVGGGHHGL